MERPIRIVLADDHPVVSIGVRNMIQYTEGFEVVGEASDGDEAITLTLESQPDILLLDLQMPRLPGLEAMRAIMNGSPTVKILLLTSTITTQQIIEALQIGARGIVLSASGTCRRHQDRDRRDRRIMARVVNWFRRFISISRLPFPSVRLLASLRELRSLTIVEGCSNQHRQTVWPERRDRETALVEHFDKTGVSTRLSWRAIAHHWLCRSRRETPSRLRESWQKKPPASRE